MPSLHFIVLLLLVVSNIFPHFFFNVKKIIVELIYSADIRVTKNRISQQCLGQEVEHVEDAEVVDHDQMGEHGDHQDMVMSHDQGEEDSGMVMMGSSSMLISK